MNIKLEDMTPYKVLSQWIELTGREQEFFSLDKVIENLQEQYVKLPNEVLELLNKNYIVSSITIKPNFQEEELMVEFDKSPENN